MIFEQKTAARRTAAQRDSAFEELILVSHLTA